MMSASQRKKLWSARAAGVLLAFLYTALLLMAATVSCEPSPLLVKGGSTLVVIDKETDEVIEEIIGESLRVEFRGSKILIYEGEFFIAEHDHQDVRLRVESQR